MADNFAVRSYSTNPFTFSATPRTYGAAAPAAPVGGLNQAMGNTSDLYSLLQQQAEERERQISEMYEPVLSRWDRMAEDLRKRQMGPSRTERLFQLAQAFLTPTKTGTAGTLGNVATALGGQAASQREIEDERQRLLEQYGTERDSMMLQQRQAMLGARNAPQDLLIKYLMERGELPDPTWDPLSRSWVYPPSPATGNQPRIVPADAAAPGVLGAEPPAALPANFFGG